MMIHVQRLGVALLILWAVIFLWRHPASVGHGADAPPADDEVSAIARSGNQFGLDLYHQLRSKSSGNLFFSPASISTALAMTYAGAAGDTAQEMSQVLHFDSLPRAQIHAAFASLLGMLQTSEGAPYQLRVANRLWGQQDYAFLTDFLTITRREYGAELAPVDFVRQTEPTRQTINQWVEQRTNDRIKDLLPSGSLSSLTRLVLTNAIYFKGQWKHAFAPTATQDAPFYRSPADTVTVPFMHQDETFSYGATDDLQILELPYVGDHLSMLVLLPRERDGLSALEQSLRIADLEKWLAGMRRKKVNVYVPRFRLSEKLELKSALSALGMPSAFDERRADFSAMNGNRDLFVSSAVHQAFVEVNEEGTEAAAATGVVVGIRSAPLMPEEFRADHPFVFLIRDHRSGQILFLGRVVDPGR